MGIVKDSSNQPIEFATVGLYRRDVKISETFSDIAGKFQLNVNDGELTLKVSAIGYNSFETVFKSSDKYLTVIMQKTTKSLKEVVVSAQRPLIEHKVDRLVFNVENSIVSQGVNALEVLRQTPMIDLSQEQIKLVGKDNLRVMIDGRLLQLSAGDLSSRLKEIRSENISKIEVITAPPAKYSAEGNSGLINIVLKKNPLLGWQFYTGAAFTQRSYPGISGYGGFNYKTSKIDVSLSVSDFDEARKYTSNRTDIFSNFIREDSGLRKVTTHNEAINALFNYAINKNMQLGITGDLTFERNRDNGKVNSTYRNINGGIDSTMLTNTITPTRYTFGDLSFFYDYNLDSTGKKLSIAYTYFSKNADKNSDINSLTSSDLDSDYSRLTNQSDATYKGNSVNLDFELPNKFVNLETGGALSFINNNVKTSPYISTGNNNLADLNVADDFKYKENTSALYISGSKSITKKISAKAGLRYEYTSLNGYSVYTQAGQGRDFGNLFPTGYISYALSPKHSFAFSYSRRIQKPDFFSLNPYRTYLTINSYSTGNPFLTPSYSRNLEFSYRFNGNLNLTVYQSRLTNGYSYQTQPMDNNLVLVSSPLNFFNKNTFGINLGYNYSPIKWFNSYDSFNLSRNSAKSYVPSIQLPNVSGNSGYLSSRNTFTINKQHSTYLEVDYTQAFPSTYDFSVLQSWSSLDFGLRSKIISNKLQVNLLVRDVLKRNQTRGKTNYTDFQERYQSYSDVRNINISLDYSFGNTKVQGVSRNSKNTDKNRVR